MEFTRKQIEDAGNALENVIRLLEHNGDIGTGIALMPLAQIVASARVGGSETLEIEG